MGYPWRMATSSSKHGPTIAAWDRNQAEAVIERFKDQDGALLPMLHALQDAFGYVHPEATDLLAETLNLSRAEVHGVISFYHDFRTEQPARLVVKVCRAEACQATGGREAARALLADLGVDWAQATSDGAVVVEPVYCLGLCAVAPSALIGDELTAGFDGPALCAAVGAAR